MKILFIYPNHKGMNMLPPAIGLLSACLKRDGHKVQLFDTTHYNSVKIGKEVDETDSDKSKSDRLMAKPYANPKEITLKYSNVFEDFKNTVDTFSPDLLALSTTEDMFHLGLSLLTSLKGRRPLTIAGGVFPTFAPELVLSFDEIDIVCKGEGEEALSELCKRIELNQDFTDIPNIWTVKGGEVIKNELRMIDMDNNPLIDMSLFEEARFYRPMGGKVYRMFPVETHRGCPYKCAFCNSPSQMTLYKEEASSNYLRRKNFDNMRRELLFYKNEMKAEYLYFWADTFFSWKKDEFEEFCELYSDVDLPFWCQTRIETINKERFEKLKDIGCSRISFGLEHGNQRFRKIYLKRLMQNKVITEGLKIVKEIGIPYNVNNILGFPYETRKLAFDTIRLNRTFEADDRNAYPFTPFTGTPLRKVCEELGFVKKTDIVRSLVANGSILNMPQFNREEVNGLVKTFNMYVKFPKNRWTEIRKAEGNSNDSQLIYNNLKEEFKDKFWKKSVSFEHSAKEVNPLS
jgi:radical SAM superfamily enzyme YgiQ (UPF0313 family)|tara:strand:+ start:598 stop:2145 length:1548 start_codon:yes stop_codon:yes gene_type:complete